MPKIGLRSIHARVGWRLMDLFCFTTPTKQKSTRCSSNVTNSKFEWNWWLKGDGDLGMCQIKEG